MATLRMNVKEDRILLFSSQQSVKFQLKSESVPSLVSERTWGFEASRIRAGSRGKEVRVSPRAYLQDCKEKTKPSLLSLSSNQMPFFTLLSSKTWKDWWDPLMERMQESSSLLCESLLPVHTKLSTPAAPANPFRGKEPTKTLVLGHRYVSAKLPAATG